MSEVAITAFRLPRGHESTLRHRRDLPNVRADIGVIEQGKWHHLARPVAGTAVLEDNRSNIFGKGRTGDAGRAPVVMRTRCLASRERQPSERDSTGKKGSHRRRAYYYKVCGSRRNWKSNGLPNICCRHLLPNILPRYGVCVCVLHCARLDGQTRACPS